MVKKMEMQPNLLNYLAEKRQLVEQALECYLPAIGSSAPLLHELSEIVSAQHRTPHVDINHPVVILHGAL